jgi:predicted nuclease of restriction endonuclease-like (RecB) superfamily
LTKNIINSEYHILLDDLKKHLRAVRYRAVVSVNKELILFYHHVGTQILKSQANNAWGAKIIDQLSRDLQSDFPEMKGFSKRNLKYMRKFVQEYPDSEFVQQPVAQIPWSRNVFLMDSFPEKQTILILYKTNYKYLIKKCI